MNAHVKEQGRYRGREERMHGGREERRGLGMGVEGEEEGERSAWRSEGLRGRFERR